MDSSVVVKWLPSSIEDRSADALALLVAHREEQLILAAPTLLRLEVLNAFWRKRVSAQELCAIAEVIEGFQLEWHEVDAGLAAGAARIAGEFPLTAYDAVFVALSRQLDAKLVTEDQAIIRADACPVRTLTE